MGSGPGARGRGTGDHRRAGPAGTGADGGVIPGVGADGTTGLVRITSAGVGVAGTGSGTTTDVGPPGMAVIRVVE